MLLPQQAPGMAARASGRERGPLARALDVRVSPAQSVLIGLFLGWIAIAAKAAINEAISSDTGYVLLMAAAVLAAWLGGFAGGLTTVASVVVLNAMIFPVADPAKPPSQAARTAAAMSRT
jgi:hypothetical protein